MSQAKDYDDMKGKSLLTQVTHQFFLHKQTQSDGPGESEAGLNPQPVAYSGTFMAGRIPGC